MGWSSYLQEIGRWVGARTLYQGLGSLHEELEDHPSIHKVDENLLTIYLAHIFSK
jgi:hypothetical protein